MDKETLLSIETDINYKFKNHELLRQAFVRKSYSQEHPELENNEVLEFYGDEALDMYVTTQLFKVYSGRKNSQFVSSKNEGELTEIKSRNVDKENLAHCIDIMGLAKYLYLNDSDQKNKVWESASVKEDLFEALIGAVAVDSDWNWKSICRVCESMLKIADFDTNYIDKLYKLCEKLGYEVPRYEKSIARAIQRQKMKLNMNMYPKFNFINQEEKTQLIEYLDLKEEDCTLIINYGDNKRFTFGPLYSSSFYTAKMRCAKQAYQYLTIIEMKQEVGEPKQDKAVTQLHELFQKGFIDEPIYKFEELHDKDGNPIWRCSCDLPNLQKLEWAEHVSKKEAKKAVAYIVLDQLMEIHLDREWGDICFF